MQRWDLRTFRLGGEWLAHHDIALASDVRTLRRSRTQGWLLTGGNDATVKVRNSSSTSVSSLLQVELTYPRERLQIWDVRDDDVTSPLSPLDRGFQGEQVIVTRAQLARQNGADPALVCQASFFTRSPSLSRIALLPTRSTERNVGKARCFSNVSYARWAPKRTW